MGLPGVITPISEVMSMIFFMFDGCCLFTRGSDLPEEVMGGKAPTFLDVGKRSGGERRVKMEKHGGKEVVIVCLRLMFLRTWVASGLGVCIFECWGFERRFCCKTKKDLEYKILINY